MKKIIVYIIIIFVNYCHTFPKWIVYSPQQYPLTEINVISSDHENSIWLSSDAVGIIKIKDTSWTRFRPEDFGLNSNSFAIEEDSNHNIWIGDQWGKLTKYDRKEWFNYTGYNSNLPKGISIFGIAIDKDDNLWMATSGGIVFWDGVNPVIYDRSKIPEMGYYVYDILIDNKGILWAIFSETNHQDMYKIPYSGLIKYDGQNWTVYSNKNSDFQACNSRALAADSNGNIWIASYPFFTLFQALQKFDGSNWTNLDDSLKSLKCTQIAPLDIDIDKDNNLWMATNNCGIFKYDGSDWTAIQSGNSGLPDNVVTAIHFDKSNRLWCGTFGGLAVYEEDPISVNSNSKLVNYQIENKPNPFSRMTEIIYYLPKPSPVFMQLYNSIGMPVAELVNMKSQNAGEHKVTFDAKYLPDGVYFYTLRTPEFTETKQMILIK